ncbi:MAG TPA: hypothetical protein VHI52_07935, partial [Verrucomicrobiae bacterium]|nr:hypothetical protein [Verrucomicrobiae bacterium]
MLSEANAATDPSQIAGQVFVWVALLAGALKCWSISRRPATNTKCALSLMFVLLVFPAAGSVALVTKALGDSALVPVAFAVLGVVVLGLVIAALVLAILGLVEYSQKRDIYTQGRAQAIWTLSLGGVLCLAAIPGFIRARQRSQDWATGPSRPGKIITVDDFNFQFRSPGRPWVPFESSRLNKA